MTLNKKIIFIVFIIAGLIFIFVLIFLISLFRSDNTPPPPPPLPSSSISPIQKTIIGMTTAEELEALEILEKSDLPTGETQYLIESELIPKPDRILTKNGVVVYESLLLPEDSSDTGFTSFSSIKSRHGEPELTLRGSEFYGWYIENWIYSSKGFTAIGNPNTDEVYEFQFYEPMTTDDFLRLYGEDINPSLSPHIEQY